MHGLELRAIIFQKKIKKENYDKKHQKPIIKNSICTGEKVAGFKDIQTGKFNEVMLNRDSKVLDVFLEKYDISVAEVKTEW